VSRDTVACRAVTLTKEDLGLLGFLAEHRVCLASQVQRLLGWPADRVQERLNALAGERLLVCEPIFQGYPAACWITRRGLGAIESRLSPPRVDLKGYRHDVGVAWLWLAARDGVFGRLAELRSERTMRSEDRRADRQGRPSGVGIGAVGAGGGERLHYPDLLLELEGGHRVAIELELTGKGAARLERIMLGYATDARIDAVVYLVPAGPLGERIKSAARRAGISDLVHVQRLARGSPEGAPDPGASRTPAGPRVGPRDRERDPPAVAR